MIDGDRYWTQRIWSNLAASQGACVQRVVHAEFTPPAEAQATVPVTFDGSPSGSAGDPIAYWEWSFGDGVRVGTPEATISHTYATPGEYEVTLTAFDIYGNSNTHTLPVEIEAPPPPPTPAPAGTTTMPALEGPAPSPAIVHLSAAQLAAKLGLPANGRKLSGAGTIALGHGECPPACGVSLSLYASVSTSSHGHRRTKQELVGSLHLKIAAKGTGGLSLTLNSTGRALLRRAGRAGTDLKVTLRVAVEDQQGAVWRLTRSLTLTGSAHTAGRRRAAARKVAG